MDVPEDSAFMKTDEVTLVSGSAGGSSDRAALENNKVRPEDASVHNWYRFVLSFPPHVVRDYLERFNIEPGSSVLDPFCGTGTTLVECKKLGIGSIGVEATPMAHFASEVKLDWSVDPDGPVAHANEVAELARKQLSADGLDEFAELPLLRNGGQRTAKLRQLPDDASKLLLKNSISPVPLHRTLVLLETLEQRNSQQFNRHERLALAKSVVADASNLRFGPEVGVGRHKSDAPVVEAWLGEVNTIAEDLRALNAKSSASARVHLADSRDLSKVLGRNSVDAVITSPPYPNEKDYTRTTRLESVLLGFIRDRHELRAQKQEILRSNTRNVYKSDTDDLLVADNKEVQRIATAIETRRVELGKTSGWERLYARVTKLYFGGMTRHLAELRNVLRPGAYLAYVVGDQASYLRIMIRTGSLLADIAASLGYEVVGIDLFRTRLSTATKQQLREEVVVLRWPQKSVRGNARR